MSEHVSGACPSGTVAFVPSASSPDGLDQRLQSTGGAHTPGPWAIEPSKWDRAELCIMGGNGLAVAHVISAKDACPIAAAPELLEALQEAHRALMHYEWYANPASGWAAPDAKFVRHMTEAAIAKAEGR